MPRINKAKRPFFCASKIDGQAYIEYEVEFDWHSGKSWQVRQRSSDAMHEAILNKFSKTDLQPNEILEVSTASHNMEVGQALSVLNLIYVDPITQKSHPLENWFQASKVFIKDGMEMGPYIELLHTKHPKSYVNPCPDKKTAERFQGDPLFDKIQSEIGDGQMSCFKLSGENYPLIPRSAFYDYLYISALCQPQNKAVAKKLMNFRVFTDIMFNPGSGKKKKFNTQARSCAIFVALSKRGVLNCGIPTFPSFIQAVRYESETIF